jgi:hypothetical protein
MISLMQGLDLSATYPNDLLVEVAIAYVFWILKIEWEFPLEFIKES